MLDYVSTLSQQSEEIEQWQYYAGARAEVFELPAGAMTLDVSYLHRDEQGFVIPDAFIASGGSPTTGNVPAKSEFSVDAFGAVLDVPLLADAPWARALGVRASADLSRFDNDHEAFSPGLTLHWDVNDEWSVSLANDHGLREPSVVELGSEVRQFLSSPFDPCTVEGRPMGDVLARCRAGFGGTVPTPVGLATAGGIVFVAIGGNADLAPERSRLREWNIHYRPEWGRGLTVDLTWYEQDLRRQIGIVSAQELLDRCYVRGQAPSCVGIVREASGTLLTIDTGFYNAPWRTHVEGYELHAAHSLEAPFGTLTFDFLAHYLARLEREGVDQGPMPFTSIGERNGTDGAIHRLRANLGATWERGDYAVSLGARYYSAVDGACLPGLDATLGADFARVCDDPERAIYQGSYLAPSPADRAGSTWFTDAQIRWNAPWHAQLSLTVRNLLDQDPPTVYDGVEGNFDPQYPVPGRFWFIAYRQAF
jgi:iron complex outermembrane receptor protein